MRKIASTILIALTSFSFLSFAYSADENQDELTTEFNFFTGMFDFSDDKQASPVLGLQHQNEELFWVHIKPGYYKYCLFPGALHTG